MALKVGLVPGLGFEPFYWDMRRRGIELCAVAPQDLSGAVERADVGAGPMSLVDAFRLEDQLQPISGFCVAAVQRAVNSLLFAQRPLEELAGLPIAAADADPTSVSLLKVIMSTKLGIEPGRSGFRPGTPRSRVDDRRPCIAEEAGSARFPPPLRSGLGMEPVDRSSFCFFAVDGPKRFVGGRRHVVGGHPVRGDGGRHRLPLPRHRAPGPDLDAAQGYLPVHTGPSVFTWGLPSANRSTRSGDIGTGSRIARYNRPPVQPRVNPGDCDAEGRDAEGRDAEGRDAEGRDAEGRDAEGRDAWRP